MVTVNVKFAVNRFFRTFAEQNGLQGYKYSNPLTDWLNIAAHVSDVNNIKHREKTYPKTIFISHLFLSITQLYTHTSTHTERERQRERSGTLTQ